MAVSLPRCGRTLLARSRTGSVVSAAAQQHCTGAKGRRGGLLQSLLLPGACFTPKLTPGCASGCQVLLGNPRFWPACTQQSESGLSYCCNYGLGLCKTTVLVIEWCSWLSLIASLLFNSLFGSYRDAV